MSNIIYFQSKGELSAQENLTAFIKFSRDNILMWSDIEGFDWQAPNWKTHYGVIRFVNLSGRQLHFTHKLTHDVLLREPFIEFTKAYLRYTQQLKATKSYSSTLFALQLLEAALIDLNNTPCITNITQRHFDRACELLQLSGYATSASTGAALERIAQDLAAWYLTIASIRFWRHPFKGHGYTAQSKKNKAAKRIKLPNDDALLAIAEVFANGYHEKQTDEDIYITCITCLLLCAPLRIGDTRWFRTNVLRDADEDNNGVKQYYLSYWVPKNSKYVRKEIPKVMAMHAKEAVRRLTLITEESRNLAKHYESGSLKFYRHSNCPAVPDDQVLTPNQVIAALGLSGENSTSGFLKKLSGNHKLTGWTLNSLWTLILLKHRVLNPYFPYQVAFGPADAATPIKMSESLFCFRYKQLANQYLASPILLTPINNSYFSSRVSSSPEMISMNFFHRHGYNNLHLTSHQLRHFLNTMAEEAGVDIEQITQWSTRASSNQTRVYMHVDPKRKTQKIGETLYPPQPLEQKPITEAEYDLMEKGPIITTRYGICTHDYTLTMCQKHADCLNCSELLMCKGHKRSIDAITEERDRIAENLYAAKAQIEAGQRVAGRWYEGHLHSVNRLNQLLQIMSDPLIDNGSPITITGKNFSHETRIINSKENNTAFSINDLRSIGIEYNQELLDCLKILRDEDSV